MKFVCDKCKTKYSIADEKVRRKVLKIRCKNCSNVIIVRESAGTDAEAAHSGAASSGAGMGEAAAGPAAGRPLAGALEGAFQRRKSSSGLRGLPDRSGLSNLPALDEDDEPEMTRLSTPPDFSDDPLPEEDEWYLAVEGNQYGPMAFNELCSRVKRGEAGAEAYVWRDGFDDWLDLNDVPELRPFLPKHPPPPPRGKSGLYNVSGLTQLPPTSLPVGGGPSAPGPAAPPQPASRGSQVQPLMGLSAPTPLPPSVPTPAPPATPASQVAPMPPPPSSVGAPDAAPGPLAALGSQAISPAGPPTAESDLYSMPGAVPQSSQDLALAPQQPVAAPSRTPLWMVIAGVGGGLAAICGLILVGYFLFFDPTEPRKQVAANTTGAGEDHAGAELAPDAGAGELEFPPMEIARSAKGERQVGSSGHRARPSKPSKPTAQAKPSAAKQAKNNLMALYGSKDSPSGAAPSTGAVRERRSGPRRRIRFTEVAALQRKHKGSLQACYERALKRDDSITDLRINVEVSYGSTGVVRKVSVSAGNNPSLSLCIRRVVKRWVFPPIGPDSISFPLIFRRAG